MVFIKGKISCVVGRDMKINETRLGASGEPLKRNDVMKERSTCIRQEAKVGIPRMKLITE